MPIEPVVKNLTIDSSDLSKLREELGRRLDYISDSRAEQETNWQKWRRAMEATPETSIRTFPWVGACNVEVPLIAITGNAIIARLYNTLFSVSPLWSVKAWSGEYEPMAEAVQSFMEVMQGPREMDMEQFLRDVVQEAVYMGVGRCEVPHQTWSHTIRHYDEQYKIVEKDITVFDGVKPWFIPIEDMFVLPERSEAMFTEFRAHRFYRNWSTIQQRVNLSGWSREEVDKMRDQPDEDPLGEIEQKGMEGFSPSATATEWAFYAFDATVELNGKMQPVMGIYHKKSQAIPRLTLPMYFDNESRFEYIPFLPRQGRQTWRGLAELLWPLQEALTTAMRQFIDNATIANTRVWAYKKSRTMPNKPELWPGRMLGFDDPANDLVPKQMGEVYGSGQTIQVLLREYAERLSGVADYQLGRESDVLRSRATATGTLAIVQEGNRLFDLETRDMRRGIARVGKKAFSRYQQFKPNEKVELVLNSKEKKGMKQAWEIPLEPVAHLLSFDLTASTAHLNRQIENQQLDQLLPKTLQYYTQVTQVFAMIVKEKAGPMKDLLLTELRGAREIMRRLYQTQEIRDIDEIVPDIDAILEKWDKEGGRNGGMVTGGEAESDRGPAGESGMAELFAPLAAGAGVGPGGGGNGAQGGP